MDCLHRKGCVTVLPDWPNDERGPLYALAVIEETIRTYGRRNVSSSVMLITYRLHCIRTRRESLTQRIYFSCTLTMLRADIHSGDEPECGVKRILFHQTDGGGTKIQQNPFEHMFYLIRETTPLATEHQ